MPPEAVETPNTRQDGVGAVPEARVGGERTARARPKEVAGVVQEAARVDRAQSLGQTVRTHQDREKRSERRLVGVVPRQ